MVAAELLVKIGCDTKEFDRNVNNAKGTASSFGDTFKGMLASNLVI